MNCRDVCEQLWSNADASANAALQSHLRTCAGCAAAAAEVPRLRTWLQDMPSDEPSAQFDWRLRLRLSQATRESHPWATMPRRWWELPAGVQFATSTALAAVLVLAVGFWWSRPRNPVTAVGGGSTVVGPPSVESFGPPLVLEPVRRGSAPVPAAVRSDSDSTRGAVAR
jgi:hypothetical protein